MSEKIYYLGSSVRLQVEWKDVDESLLTPGTQEWKLYDGKDVLVTTLTEADLELESEGVYYHDYTTELTENPGTYHLTAKATKDDRIGICRKAFKVKES